MFSRQVEGRMFGRQVEGKVSSSRAGRMLKTKITT
jgi:hypothetical protein